MEYSTFKELISLYTTEQLYSTSEYKLIIEKFQKSYKKNKFKDFESVINIFKDVPYFNIINTAKLAKSRYSEPYINAKITEVDDKNIYFHSEFEDIIFYYLLTHLKNSCTDFLEYITKKFSSFYNCNSKKYEIPFIFYNEYYESLPNESKIKMIIKLLVSLDTFTIVANLEKTIISINTNKIKNYINDLAFYNFSEGIKTFTEKQACAS